MLTAAALTGTTIGGSPACASEFSPLGLDILSLPLDFSPLPSFPLKRVCKGLFV